MPNWKKVIVSGSDAVLNSLNVTTSLTASGLIYPTVDGTANQVIQTDGLGNLSFGSVDTTYEVVKNVAGTTLYKGTPVHATASNASGNVVGIIAASASNPATMPATFILNEDLADEAEGYAIISGLIQGVDTSAFEEGDVVYVGESSGYTNVKPTGSNLIQNLGIVTKIHPSNGAGIVLGAGRSNDVPNLLSGEVFWGENNRSIQKPLAHILSGSSYIYSGSFSGSFQGDGSGLTGIQVASLESNLNVTSFTNTGSITINHNLGATYPLVQVYDVTDNQIIPESVEVIDTNNIKVTFGSNKTGNIVIGKGGDVIDLTQILPPTTRAVTGSFTSVTSTTITHNLATENILVSVYDNTKNYIIPDSIQILNENNVQIGFTSPTTGYAVVTNGGHIVSGSIEWTNVLNKPSGLVSSSAQISITESQISDLTHYTDSDVLSYLTTGVGGTIVPSTTDIYDLGSPTKRWGDVYLTSASIYLNNAKISATSNGFISGSFSGSFVGDGSQLSGVTSYTDADTLSYINTLGVVSGSVNWDTLSGRPSGIISSSAQLSNSTIPGNLTIGGKITAQEFHTEFVSASIIYQSGSTQFGDTIDDTHTFIGTLSATTIQNVFSSSAQIDYNSIQNQPTIPTNNNQLTNGAGYTTCTGTVGGSGTSGYLSKWNGSTSQTNSVIYDNGTNIGIGTTSPANFTNYCTLSIDGTNGGILNLMSNGTNAMRLASDLDRTYIYEERNVPITISTNNTERMRIDAGGNVGIGTTSPSSKLEVNGTFYTNIGNTSTGCVLFEHEGSNNPVPFSLRKTGYAGTSNGFGILHLDMNHSCVGGGSNLYFRLLDSTGNWTEYAGIGGVISDNTNGSEDGHLYFYNMSGGSNRTVNMKLLSNGDLIPGANGTQNLGSSTYRWNTVYTSDLSLKNDIGDWTIVEGEEDLFLYNNKKDKVYKFNLTEVDKDSAPKKRS